MIKIMPFTAREGRTLTCENLVWMKTSRAGNPIETIKLVETVVDISTGSVNERTFLQNFKEAAAQKIIQAYELKPGDDISKKVPNSESLHIINYDCLKSEVSEGEFGFEPLTYSNKEGKLVQFGVKSGSQYDIVMRKKTLSKVKEEVDAKSSLLRSSIVTQFVTDKTVAAAIQPNTEFDKQKQTEDAKNVFADAEIVPAD